MLTPTKQPTKQPTTPHYKIYQKHLKMLEDKQLILYDGDKHRRATDKFSAINYIALPLVKV